VLNLDPAKVLVILVIALVVLGPERLPAVARQLAAMVKEINRLRDQVRDEVRSALPDVDLPKIPKIPTARGAIAGLFSDPANDAGRKNGATYSSPSNDGAPAPTRVPGVRAASNAKSSFEPYTMPPDDPGMN
jgi:sec-independent protein translocase protein TatB